MKRSSSDVCHYDPGTQPVPDQCLFRGYHLRERVHRRFLFDAYDLERIVAEDEKGRYSFNEDKTLIRANQGHSIPVDVELERKAPPEYLFHGTGEKSVGSIKEQGLLPMSRLYVHLSPDYDTAVKVGSRHGKPFVFKVAAEEMNDDGYDFYLSVNGVWLTKTVPNKYLIY